MGYKCNRLVKLQKRLVKIITRSKYNAHTDPLFECTELLKVADTLDLNALKFYYKYLHGKLPSYFYSFKIVTQRSQHTYNTQQSEQIRTERTQAEYCDNRLRIYLRGLVNTVPLHLLEGIATHSIQGFSFGIKYHFLNVYPKRVLHCQLLQLSLQPAINEMHIFFFNLRWSWGGQGDLPASLVASGRSSEPPKWAAVRWLLLSTLHWILLYFHVLYIYRKL